MIWTIEFAQAAIDDLGLILDHLIDSYLTLGESQSQAFDRVQTRVSQIFQQAAPLSGSP